MRKSQNVEIPNGLIRELKQWVEDELEGFTQDTQFRRDLADFYDHLDIAEQETKQ